MPNLQGQAALKMPARSAAWRDTCTLRIRAVLNAARSQRCETLVLGDFGCGAFGNPPDAVADLFQACLRSDEFRGCFRLIVFAILEFKSSDTGNFAAFADALASLCK